jgi:hypothetical protein
MDADPVDDVVRHAIGGDGAAVDWIATHAGTSDHALVLVMAALLSRDPAPLGRARVLATTSRHRQIVEIACAHLAGQREQVDALARDHLVDHPDSLLVAWIASGAIVSAAPNGGR